jgi:hypothetical protein
MERFYPVVYPLPIFGTKYINNVPDMDKKVERLVSFLRFIILSFDRTACDLNHIKYLRSVIYYVRDY